MIGPDGLPSGWRLLALGDVAQWSSGGTPKRTNPRYFGGSIPWVVIGDLNDGVVTNSSTYITEEGLRASSAKWVPPGAVLLAMYGSIGKLGIAGTTLTTNQAIAHAIANDEIVEAKYLFWYLRSIRRELITEGKGGTQQNISQTIIKGLPIPVPPLDAQRRIVAAIEEQLSRLDVAVGSLIHGRAKLVRYREAVISTALSGANALGRSGDESTGQTLVEAVLRARKQRWVDDKNVAPYREPAASVGHAGSQLPSTWSIASLEQLTDPIRTISYGILMPKEDVPNGVPYVRVKDIRVNRIELSNLRRTSAQIAAAHRRSSLRAGDILIAIRGSYGRVAEVPQELEGGNITQDTARLDVSPLVDRRYVAAYLRGPVAQRYFRQVARGVAVKGVNIGDLRALPVPVPPLADQAHIVAEIDRELTDLDELAAEVLAASARSTSLRSSILSAAFSGRLPLTPVGCND